MQNCCVITNHTHSLVEQFINCCLCHYTPYGTASKAIYIGFKPPLDPVNCKGGAYARGRRHVTARASRIDNVLLRLGRRVTTGDQAVFFLSLFAMTSEGSSASASGSSLPSTTDLKGLIKDSLRELLHDEPALLRGAVGRAEGVSRR